MKRSFRLAVAFAALLAISACTNSGMDDSGLQQLRSEQAASANPPPPPGIDVGATQPAATPTDPAVAGGVVPANAAAPASAASAFPPPAAAAPSTAAPATASGLVAAAGGPARIHFAPVIGAAPQAVSPLAARLTARATQRGLGVAASDAASTHVLKGYFSAFTEKRETTVIYVWDVLDQAGNRVHRIQGQQKVTGVQGEGWNSVTPQVMEAIADRTIDDLATWLVSRAG